MSVLDCVITKTKMKEIVGILMTGCVRVASRILGFGWLLIVVLVTFLSSRISSILLILISITITPI